VPNKRVQQTRQGGSLKTARGAQLTRWTLERALVPRIADRLLRELHASRGRLDDWIKTARFSKPQRKSVPDPTFKTWPLVYVAKICGLFIARFDWNMRAIGILCDNGLAVQSQPILRAALESSIDLRYISSNPQTLVTKWCLHEDLERYRFWKARPSTERPSDYGLIEKQAVARVAAFDRHFPKSNGRQWTLKELCRDWDVSNLAERDKKSRELLDDEPSVYDFYRLLSGTSHGDAQAATDFVLSDDNGKFELVSGIENRKLVFVPWLTLYCMHMTVSSSIRCGAAIDEQVGPRWDDIGVSPSELLAASLADFEFHSV